MTIDLVFHYRKEKNYYFKVTMNKMSGFLIIVAVQNIEI